MRHKQKERHTACRSAHAALQRRRPTSSPRQSAFRPQRRAHASLRRCVSLPASLCADVALVAPLCVRAQVITESYTGSVFMELLGIEFYNAYQSIGAVGLRVFEPGTEHLPAVLIGAHFDSSIGTPGASAGAKAWSCGHRLEWQGQLEQGCSGERPCSSLAAGIQQALLGGNLAAEAVAGLGGGLHKMYRGARRPSCCRGIRVRELHRHSSESCTSAGGRPCSQAASTWSLCCTLMLWGVCRGIRWRQLHRRGLEVARVLGAAPAARLAALAILVLNSSC